MGCRGVHFALTQEQDENLTGMIGNDEAISDYIMEEIEEQWDEAWLCETDKAWDAIHRCLTDGGLDIEPLSPLHMAILGGRHLYSEDDYIVSYVDKADVPAVASQLNGITASWMKEKYFALNPDDYGMDPSEDDWEYTWSWFSELVKFYTKAAEDGRSVVFTADQ